MIKPMVQKALIKSLPHLERAGKKAGDHLLNASKESIKDILKNKKSGKEVLEKQQNALKRKLTEIALETMEGKGKQKKKRKQHNSEDISRENSLSTDQANNRRKKRKTISGSSAESGSDSDIF